MLTGTIRSQVQLQMLDQKWQKKKTDMAAGKKEDKELTAEEREWQNYQDQMDKIRESDSYSQIYTKLKSGGTLTEEEIQRLKERDPEALAEYERAQAEKKQYEKQLKNCKTKEDVEKLKMNRMGNFAARAKEITNNPYIPKHKKVELMNQLNNEVCLIADAHARFTKSAEYHDLPTEGEEQEKRAPEAADRQDREADPVQEAAERQDGEADQIQKEAEVGTEQMELTDAENAGQMTDLSSRHPQTEDLSAESDHPDEEKLHRQQTDTTTEPVEMDIDFENIYQNIQLFLRKEGAGNGKFSLQV